MYMYVHGCACMYTVFVSRFTQILGSKIQDFFQTFYKTIFSFLQNQGYKIGD